MTAQPAANAGGTDADEPDTLRAIGRIAFAAALRALFAVLVLELAMLAVTVVVLLAKNDPYSYRFTGRYWKRSVVPTLLAQGVLAVGFASMRVVEPLAARLRPDASYPRKLAAGIAVGLGVLVLTSGFLVEIYYVLGMLERTSIEGGLSRIGAGDWFSSRYSGSYRPTDMSPETLVGFAAPFALAGFARARKLPLREQVALVGVFMLLWFGTRLVFSVAYGDSLFLASWIVFWLSATSAPRLARGGDALEERWMPDRLRARGGA